MWASPPVAPGAIRIGPWVINGYTIEPDNAGYLAGGQLGYNYQVGHFVWGVEGDYGLSNARGASSTVQPMAPFTSCEDDVNALGSVTGRLGYTFGRALFYGKGGWAFGEVSAGMHREQSQLRYAFGRVPLAASATRWEKRLDRWRRHGDRPHGQRGLRRPNTCTMSSRRKRSQ